MGRRKKKAGEPLPGRGRTDVGDVVAIPLADDFWGYARRYESVTLGIYSAKSKGKILRLEDLNDCSVAKFSVFLETWKSPTWIFLGNIPFKNDDESWAPDAYQLHRNEPDVISIIHRGNYTRTRDKSLIEGLEECTGMLMPGNLIELIRSVLNLPVLDRVQIEAVAPYNDCWHGHTSGAKCVYPITLMKCSVREFRLLFPKSRWLHAELENDSKTDFPFNGLELEGVIKVLRFANNLPVVDPDIEYISREDCFLIVFKTRADAEQSALLLLDAIKNKSTLVKMIKVAQSIEEIGEQEGLPSPWSETEMIRTQFAKSGIDRLELDRYDPDPEILSVDTSAEDLIYPFSLSEEDEEEYQLVFAEWDWLRNELGSDSVDGFYFNGYGMESLIKAVRLANSLPIDLPGIEYNSSGDSCLITFTDSNDAEQTALMTIQALQSKSGLVKMLDLVRKNGFEEG